MSDSAVCHIRPAGRHILTIGRELIANVSSALLELVKNAYDADARKVEITISAEKGMKGVKVVVADDGHGMSRQTVVDKWMTPSTGDKLKRKNSPRGRILQGRKGIGRFASAVLGGYMALDTVSNGKRTTLCLQWDQFEKAAYLDDVEVLIETVDTDAADGTTITVEGDATFLRQWTESQLDKAKHELQKLISPIPVHVFIQSHNPVDVTNDFSIVYNVDGFGSKDLHETLAPIHLFDLYDYRIRGSVFADGTSDLVYSCQKGKNIQDQKLAIDSSGTGCGNVYFDIRVYDRDPDSIAGLVRRSKSLGNEFTGSLEARQALNEYNGVGVYRNGFRINEMGDSEHDWLNLNRRRVQNPSMRIGSDQVIGCVQIESEELSGLEEKSARDGLKGTDAYSAFVSLTHRIIALLEERRFKYRADMGIGRTDRRVNSKISDLLDYSDLKEAVRRGIKKSGLPDDSGEEIIKILDKRESQAATIVEELRKAIAVYQGQATLGKIMAVVLHEGRRPLDGLINDIPHLRQFHELYVATKEEQYFDKSDSLLRNTEHNVDSFVGIFKRIDPFAVTKRGPQKAEPIVAIVEESRSLFSKVMEKEGISLSVTGDVNVVFPCWKSDMLSVFANLIDNSVFWMVEKRSPEKRIVIDLALDVQGGLVVEYRDTGPGIDPDLIADQVIFEPNFTTKEHGIGIGLAIVGEAADRNGLSVSAIESNSGAYFRIATKVVEVV